MISGDKAHFAIEYDLDQNFGGKWLFGRMAFWIGGERLGDYEQGTSLTDVLGSICGIVKYAGRRSAAGLCFLPADDVFDLVDSAVFGRNDPRFDQYVTDELLLAAPGILILTPSVDIFDHCRAYVLECEDFDRVIYKKNFDSNAVSVRLGKGIIQSATRPVHDWLDALYEKHCAQGSSAL